MAFVSDCEEECLFSAADAGEVFPFDSADDNRVLLVDNHSMSLFDNIADQGSWSVSSAELDHGVCNIIDKNVLGSQES